MMFSNFLTRSMLFALLAGPVYPQSQAIPLTPDRHPDLQGNWVDNFATPFERPKELEGRPFLTDQEVATMKERYARLFQNGRSDVALPNNLFPILLANPARYVNPNAGADSAFLGDMDFDNRTSLITDPPNGRLPEYTPAGERRRSIIPAGMSGKLRRDNVKELFPAERCISFGVPRVGANYSRGLGYGYYQIVQTSDSVLFFMEVAHEARIIPLDGQPHLPPSVRAWDGDSHGRWEGGTLVVDTANFRPETNYLGAGENLHLIERFRLASPDELQYEIRVDDSTTWTHPWSAMVRLKRTKDQLYEFACHEGNAENIEGLLAAAAKDK
jgi:hypothetical protein